MRVRLAPFITLLFLSTASAQTAQPVYDVLERAWSPYLAKDDPAKFAMKIKAVSASPRSYWGGAKDLFFIWAKRECADWFDKSQRFTTCHADVHAGNVGTYPSKFGEMSIGLIDFDDAAQLPVEIDVLQACVSIRLAAMQHDLKLNDVQLDEICQIVISTYNGAAKRGEVATTLFAHEEAVQTLLAGAKRPYTDLLHAYTNDGRFRRTVANKRGEVRDILTPAMNRSDELSAAIARSIERAPALAAKLRITTAAEIRVAIKDVAIRTRLGSAGSQGLDKIFILLDRPLRGVDHDVILYLKQEVASAAERTVAAPRESRTPAERVAAAVADKCEPDPFINASVEVSDGKSYLLTLFEPWSAELEDITVTSSDDLSVRATIIGGVLGAAHRIPIDDRDAQFQIIDRSRQYMSVLLSEWQSLRDDPRTQKRIAEADAFIDSARSASR